MIALVLLLSAAAVPSNAAAPSRRTLSTLAPGWEVDHVGEAGQTLMPRIAWSRDLDTVLYVARSGSRLRLAVNDAARPVDEVGVLSFTPDGLTPVYTSRHDGKAYLSVGARTFGPFDEVERPALSSDGSLVAFKAVSRSQQLAVVGGTVAARGPYISSPVLDPKGKAAWWALDQGRWTLWWDGKPAPGTPFDAHGSDPDQVGAPVFSADGVHIAFRRREEDGRARIVRDGKPGPLFLAVAEPIFSPDGDTLSYGAAAGPEYDLNTMVEGERAVSILEPAPDQGAKAPGPRAIRYVWGARYLHDGRLMYFAFLLDGKTCFVLAGQASAEFPSASEPAFDAGSRHAGFIARGDKDARAVLDGVPGPVYDAVHYLQFDASGRRWAYTAEKDSAAFVVADGLAGPRFDEVGWVRFSPSGGTLAYWGRRGILWYTVLNGSQTSVGITADLMGNLILGGTDEATPIYSAREGGLWYLYIEGRRNGPYDELGPFYYDAKAGGVVAGTREGRSFIRRFLPVP